MDEFKSIFSFVTVDILNEWNDTFMQKDGTHPSIYMRPAHSEHPKYAPLYEAMKRR
jgi:hypothetical protein